MDMSSNTSGFEEAIEILRAVAEGHEHAQQELERWPAPEKSADQLLKNAWHALYHYMADEDIRQREPQYEKNQKETLIRFAAELDQNLRSKRTPK